MNNMELAMAFARCESEEEVFSIIKNHKLETDFSWEYFGRMPNCFSIIGNQQDSADAALVEKLTNSVDAILIKECLCRGINPESPQAPRSIPEALKLFFGIKSGNLSELTTRESTHLAENGIIFAASGSKATPCYTIVDRGEGQSPKRLPDTILSLIKSNKAKIPFVQGEFNMGGTGVFPYCGSKRYQLIITKRCPNIPNDDDDETFSDWAFTLVRREEAVGNEKHSKYTYLTDKQGNILSFKCDKGLALIPKRESSKDAVTYNTMDYGMFLKLFDYKIPLLQTSITGNMAFRLSLLLPNLPYPIKLVECRSYGSHTLSGTLTGLITRLSREKAEGEIEKGFPLSFSIAVDGQNIIGSIYVFKDSIKKADMKKYKDDEGVIFIRNGQTHGHIKKSIIRQAKLAYLEDHLLVILDCSNMSKTAKEDMFMNSRDKIRKSEVSEQIKEDILEILKGSEPLKTLNDERRRKQFANNTADNKPLKEVLSNILKKSPTLSRLFLDGLQLQNPFNLSPAPLAKKEYNGKRFPSYFILKKKGDEKLEKNVPIGHKCRIQFETDVENDYFSREEYRGESKLFVNNKLSLNAVFNLYNGIGTLNVIPPNDCRIGDLLEYRIEIRDSSRVEPFIEYFTLKIIEDNTSKNPNESGHRIRPIDPDNTGTGRMKPSGLAIPEPQEVRKDKWEDHNMNKESALVIKDGLGDNNYDFYINMDNIHLNAEIKLVGKNDEKIQILQLRYKFSLVLLGLAIINYHKNHSKSEDESFDLYELVSKTTSSISAVLLPMIESMAGIGLDEISD